MRRVAALALAVLPLLACSGEQGERAQQLLTRAQAAQAQLTSATYEARMNVSMDGQRFSVPLPASTTQQYDWSSTMLDLAR